MGIVPEPAPCADDVSRLAPSETMSTDEAVAWLPRAERKARRTRATTLCRAGLAILAGLAIEIGLPQSAVAPAASAHDRLDARSRTESSLVTAFPPASPAPWAGVPVIEQEPPTLDLIASDLAALPQPQDGAESENLRFGEMTVPRRVVDTILRASEETGADPAYMMALADKESGFSTSVKAATSSAEGMFQFLAATWLEMIRSYGARHGLEAEAAAVTGRGAAITVADDATRERILRLRQDPFVAALMAGELIKRDQSRIEQRIGRGLKTSELYLAHFLGAASAGRFLAMSVAKPAQVARRIFRSAAKANRSLFIDAGGKGGRSLTVAEVHERLDDMIDRRLTQYGGVAALAASRAPKADAPAGPLRVRVTEAIPPADEP